MKTKNPGKALLMAGMVMLICGASSSWAQSTQQIFEEAKKAYYRGDLELAKAGLERVLSNDPRHTTARAYLGRIRYKIKEDGNKGANSLQGKAEALIVPTIEFQDATLGSVIDFLPKKAAELTDGKFEPSIVFKGPADELIQKKITLKLVNVPFSEVLRYLGELSEVNFKYDKYAIVAIPNRDLPAAAPVPVKQEASSIPAKGGGNNPFGQGGGSKDPFR